MIGDGPIFESETFHVPRDFLQAVVSVTPDRMIVQGASQIRPLDGFRQVFLSGGKFTMVFTQFGRDKRQIQSGENVRLLPAGHEQSGIMGFDFGLEQSVFIQPQAALNRALAHNNIVFLAAREIGQGKWEFPVADDP